MVELDFSATRGSLLLEMNCRLTAPWTVVFGPSGSGKSTLLRIIAGLDRADKGRIVIHDRVVADSAIRNHLPPGHQRCGLVLHRPALFPHLSVRENIGYGLRSMSASERRSRIEAALALTGAEDLANRPLRALSGGESQRIALARALAPMPRLLLLDEPLSALGADARDQLLTRLQAWLMGQKIQTILVTHDAADALATAADVAILNEGKLAAFGPASEVLAAERKRLLARLNSD